ncbi:MAG: metallophosphoesterase family protein [Fuerstiella sp.]|nr:metallophosphoesterase family protein [Fuerstiella sp.]
MKLALFGGLYSNYLALEAAVADAQQRGVDAMFCLGDLGAFGPHPNRVFPLLRDHDISCVQGNYDDSIGHELNDCQCGYADPNDNYFAQVSYDYTLQNTSADNKAWLRSLPKELRLHVDGLRVLLCHGSPRRTNEFLWQSNTSTAFLDRLADEWATDLMVGTHSGIHWQRELRDGRRYVNVGVLGRPENDGTTNVWYAVLCTGSDAAAGALPCTANGTSVPISVNFVPVIYDHTLLAEKMQQEQLPDEFIQTVLTGWWTTCLEVLPSHERRMGRF